jgi:phosphate transport system permease protein
MKERARRRLPRVSRRDLIDRAAGLFVRAGGIGIIASILAILLFIAGEVWPLMRGARVEPAQTLSVAATPRALAADPYRTHIASLDDAGEVQIVRRRDGAVVLERRLADLDAALAGDAIVAAAGGEDGTFVSAMTADGRVAVVPIQWTTVFESGKRRVVPMLGAVAVVRPGDDGAARPPYAVRVANGGADLTVAAVAANGQLSVVRRTREENQFTGEVKDAEHRFAAAAPDDLVGLVLAGTRGALFGATAGGDLQVWLLGPDSLRVEERVSAGAAGISAIELLIGGRSLVVGHGDGAISVWQRVPLADGGARLTRIRDLPPLDSAVRFVVPSQRDKGFLAVDDSGGLGLYHSTAERLLWKGSAPIPRVSAVAFAPKANMAFVGGAGEVASLAIDNPHPDVSLWSLFGPVWYEGYAAPTYVWQSSSANDDFEPKFSLVPLLIGTLKGTFYSLLIAIPLGVLGAMYVSQFMHPDLRGVVKPVVEIMAALPSVVLGFLAGLWLAPRVEQAFPALLLMMFLFPPLIVAAGAVWEALPKRFRNRFPGGSEVLFFLVVLAAALWLCIALSRPLEVVLFDGSFPAWLRRVTGLTYDQRNAVVVGLAMGFAVIPIIFAISEDAFSNVPRDLVSGSLALGANRWQTVTRVVLPTASPGIFSAIMVGFGRAVGETMIVLMATGNTPIRDWNPFNGFRTLSANIAVEIPEAPQFSTLYRVLFLAALLLFVTTFVVNTAAELVRQRLRERYARL